MHPCKLFSPELSTRYNGSVVVIWPMARSTPTMFVALYAPHPTLLYPPTPPGVFCIAVVLLCFAQADSASHEQEGEGELFDGGQEFLDRMAIAVGGKSLVPAAGERNRRGRGHRSCRCSLGMRCWAARRGEGDMCLGKGTACAGRGGACHQGWIRGM